jgi:hypothetical protein
MDREAVEHDRRRAVALVIARAERVVLLGCQLVPEPFEVGAQGRLCAVDLLPLLHGERLERRPGG